MDLNDIDETHEHASASLKVILLVFAILLVGALAYLVAYEKKQNYGSNEAESTTQETSAESASTTTETKKNPCDFSTVTASVTPGKTFNVFGEEAFSTIVCGYIVTKEQNVGMDEVLMKNVAYVAVTKFKDEGFKKAIESGLGEGNTVNAKSGNAYLLGCGCLENNKIVASPEPAGGLMSDADQAKFIASSEQSPVILKLTYEVHGGSGCSCCTLFEKAEVL